MIVYSSILQYMESKDSLIEQIELLDNLIKGHREMMLENIGSSGIERHAYDDGQIRIDTVYRSPMAISNAIQVMVLEKKRLITQLNEQNGCIIELRDKSSFLNN